MGYPSLEGIKRNQGFLPRLAVWKNYTPSNPHESCWFAWAQAQEAQVLVQRLQIFRAQHSSRVTQRTRGHRPRASGTVPSGFGTITRDAPFSGVTEMWQQPRDFLVLPHEVTCTPLGDWVTFRVTQQLGRSSVRV